MYDIAVIGGGPGGYTAAIFAAKKGKKVVVIEKDNLGGTCLNWGCIPTKALVHSANIFNELKEAEEFGVKVAGAEIDWTQAQKKKDEVVFNLTSGVGGLLRQNKVDVISGEAEMIDRNKIQVKTSDFNKEVSAEFIIIATGAEPIMPLIPGIEIDGVVTSKEALSFDDIPEKLIVIGGGVIGSEMGYIYNSLGSEVTVIEMLSKILGNMDEECSSALQSKLEENGMKIRLDSKVLSFERNGKEIAVKYESNGENHTIIADKVLVSIGRKPSLKGVSEIGLKTGRAGIEVDEHLKTSIDNIYAIGDVTGKIQLAHVASHQGITAVKNILGETEKMDYSVVPSCIYTNPEIASVGLSEEEAREKYRNNIKVSVFPYLYNGKSLTIGNTEGFIKMISESKYNQIIGVHIVGPCATEIIAEATMAIKLECTAEEIAGIIHAHPSLSEAFMEAAAGIDEEAIHAVSTFKI